MGSPEKREHHLREHRLNEEQEQGADEERRREENDDRHVPCDYRTNQAGHVHIAIERVEGASSAPLTTARVSSVDGRLSSNRRVPKGMTASETGTKRRADTVLAGRDTLTRQHRIRDRMGLILERLKTP